MDIYQDILYIYQDVKHQGIYPLLFTDPEGDSCFSIYQIIWIKKRCFNFFFWNFRETMHHFSPCSQKQWISKDIPSHGSQSKTREKLLSTDLVNNNWMVIVPFPYFAWDWTGYLSKDEGALSCLQDWLKKKVQVIKSGEFLSKSRHCWCNSEEDQTRLWIWVPQKVRLAAFKFLGSESAW